MATLRNFLVRVDRIPELKLFLFKYYEKCICLVNIQKMQCYPFDSQRRSNPTCWCQILLRAACLVLAHIAMLVWAKGIAFHFLNTQEVKHYSALIPQAENIRNFLILFC